MNKKILKYFTFLILVAGIVFAAKNLGSQSSYNPVTVSNWAAYTEENIGFSLDYPADWYFRKGSIPGEIMVFSYDPTTTAINTKFGIGQMKLSTYIYENTSNENLEIWLNSRPVDQDFPVTINRTEHFILKERQAFRVNTAGYMENISESVYISLDDGKILQIAIMPATSESIVILDRIIASISFK